MRKTGMMTSLIVLALVSSGVVVEAGPWFGACPAPETISTIDVNRYLGRWYNIQADWATPFQPVGTACITATYSLRDDGAVNVVNNGYYWPWSFTSGLTSIEGAALCFADEGKCRVEFFKEPSADSERNYLILDTDYDNYSIVYTCRNYAWGLIRWDYHWVLARTPTMTDDLYNQMYQIIADKVPSYVTWFWRTFPIQGDGLCTY